MRRSVGAFTLAALAVAGCGGSSDDHEAASPTRAEFIAQTDARCQTSNARTRDLNAEVVRVSQGVTDERVLLRRLAPVLERGSKAVGDNADAFAATTPLPADAKKIAELRTLYERQATLAGRLAAAAKRGDVDDFRLYTTEQTDVLARVRQRAKAFGFKECGSAKSDAT